jgi:large subunit ribosomal protein L5
MSVRLLDIYNNQISPKIKESFNFSSIMEVPRLEKIVLSMGAGSYFADSAKMEQAFKALTHIAGQKARYCKAKKSIASFKVREGMNTGIMVTLRKSRMYEFMDRLHYVVLPRMRDFRGFDEKSMNGKSFSFGIKDYLIRLLEKQILNIMRYLIQ